MNIICSRCGHSLKYTVNTEKRQLDAPTGGLPVYESCTTVIVEPCKRCKYQRAYGGD